MGGGAKGGGGYQVPIPPPVRNIGRGTPVMAGPLSGVTPREKGETAKEHQGRIEASEEAFKKQEKERKGKRKLRQLAVGRAVEQAEALESGEDTFTYIRWMEQSPAFKEAQQAFGEFEEWNMATGQFDPARDDGSNVRAIGARVMELIKSRKKAQVVYDKLPPELQTPLMMSLVAVGAPEAVIREAMNNDNKLTRKQDWIRESALSMGLTFGQTEALYEGDEKTLEAYYDSAQIGELHRLSIEGGRKAYQGLSAASKALAPYLKDADGNPVTIDNYEGVLAKVNTNAMRDYKAAIQTAASYILDPEGRADYLNTFMLESYTDVDGNRIVMSPTEAGRWDVDKQGILTRADFDDASVKQMIGGLNTPASGPGVVGAGHLYSATPEQVEIAQTPSAGRIRREVPGSLASRTPTARRGVPTQPQQAPGLMEPGGAVEGAEVGGRGAPGQAQQQQAAAQAEPTNTGLDVVDPASAEGNPEIDYQVRRGAPQPLGEAPATAAQPTAEGFDLRGMPADIASSVGNMLLQGFQGLTTPLHPIVGARPRPGFGIEAREAALLEEQARRWAESGRAIGYETPGFGLPGPTGWGSQPAGALPVFGPEGVVPISVPPTAAQIMPPAPLSAIQGSVPGPQMSPQAELVGGLLNQLAMQGPQQAGGRYIVDSRDQGPPPAQPVAQQIPEMEVLQALGALIQQAAPQQAGGRYISPRDADPSSPQPSGQQGYAPLPQYKPWHMDQPR